MYNSLINAPSQHAYSPFALQFVDTAMQPPLIKCNWVALREQLLQQWERVTRHELESAGPNRRLIAKLIEKKYGIASAMVENYLRNFERTLPLAN